MLGQHGYDPVSWSTRHVLSFTDQMSVGKMLFDQKMSSQEGARIGKVFIIQTFNWETAKMEK
jgi:hypothetical protein